MNIALVSGLIILILLVIMLIAGVPIAVSPLLPARSAFSLGFPCSACWQSRSLSWPAIL